MATDTFAPNKRHEDWSPAIHAFAITPSNEEELAYVTRSIYVGVGGTIAVVMASGDEVTFVGVQAGSVLPVRVKQVKVTGTNATNMIGLY